MRPARTAVSMLLLAGTALLPGPHALAMGIPAARSDRLTVSYDDGSHRLRTYALTCGDRGDRGDACEHLDEIGGPVPAVPAGQMCSMIYGGPQTAEVRGIWHGRPVRETYRRTNGCEVARWSRMVPVLPAPSGAEPYRRLQG